MNGAQKIIHIWLRVTAQVSWTPYINPKPYGVGFIGPLAYTSLNLHFFKQFETSNSHLPQQSPSQVWVRPFIWVHSLSSGNSFIHIHLHRCCLLRLMRHTVWSPLSRKLNTRSQSNPSKLFLISSFTFQAIAWYLWLDNHTSMVIHMKW